MMCSELRFWGRLARRVGFLGQSGGLDLFGRLLSADTDGDGLLSPEELAGVLASPGVSLDAEDFCLDSTAAGEDWSVLLERMIQGTPGLAGRQASTSTEQDAAAPVIRCRWLDLLILFDRLATWSANGGAEETPGQGSGSPSAPLEPAGMGSAEGGGLVSRDLLARLRARCLRCGIHAEDLKENLANLHSVKDVRAFFGAVVGLGEADVDSFAHLFEQAGPRGMLLRVPLSEAGLPSSKKQALLRKFATASRDRKEELWEGFGIWGSPERLTSEQFRTVCLDVLAQDLTPREVEDLKELYLFPSGEEVIDGKKVLEGSQPNQT